MGKPCFDFLQEIGGMDILLGGSAPKWRGGGGGVLKVHDVLLARAQFCWHICKDARVFYDVCGWTPLCTCTIIT